jgi:hypothetical protein
MVHLLESENQTRIILPSTFHLPVSDFDYNWSFILILNLKKKGEVYCISVDLNENKRKK